MKHCRGCNDAETGWMLLCFGGDDTDFIQERFELRSILVGVLGFYLVKFCPKALFLLTFAVIPWTSLQCHVQDVIHDEMWAAS